MRFLEQRRIGVVVHIRKHPPLDPDANHFVDRREEKRTFAGSPGPTDTVYLGVFRRDVLDRLGFYDVTLPRNQDYELNYRIRSAGGVVYFHPDLEVEYQASSSIGELWNQYFNYGRWKRRMVTRYPRSLRWRQVAAPTLVVGLAVSAALVLTPWRQWALLVPGIYAIALAAASLLEGVIRRDPAALLLPVVYPTMHLGWGIGFWIGPPR